MRFGGAIFMGRMIHDEGVVLSTKGVRGDDGGVDSSVERPPL
jgi:hypothetical protein